MDRRPRRARLHRVQQHVRQRATQRVDIAEDHRRVRCHRHRHRRLRGNRTPCRGSRQFPHVHLRLRPFRQSPELREAPCHHLEPLRLRVQHVDRFRQLRRRLPAQPRHREPDRRERILEFVRHLSRRLAQRGRTLRLECSRAPKPQLARHLSHPVPQEHELRRPLSRRPIRQRFTALDRGRPPNELAQRTAQVAAQVTRHPGRDHREEQRRAQGHERCRDGCTPRHQELHLSPPQQPFIQRALVLREQRPLRRIHRCPPRRAQRARPRARDPLHRRHGAEQRQGAHHGELPRHGEHDRRDEREGEKDDEKTGAKADLLHGHSVRGTQGDVSR